MIPENYPPSGYDEDRQFKSQATRSGDSYCGC